VNSAHVFNPTITALRNFPDFETFFPVLLSFIWYRMIKHGFEIQLIALCVIYSNDELNRFLFLNLLKIRPVDLDRLNKQECSQSKLKRGVLA
jgi:hypothetical protein